MADKVLEALKRRYDDVLLAWGMLKEAAPTAGDLKVDTKELRVAGDRMKEKVDDLAAFIDFLVKEGMI